MSFILKIKALLIFLLNSIKRVFCCFKKKRRFSYGDQAPLLNVVVKGGPMQQEAQAWNDWDFKNRAPSSVEEHIDYYRQQQAKLRQPKHEDDETEDLESKLFDELAPKITKQAKIVVVQNAKTDLPPPKLDLAVKDAVVTAGDGLEDWQDANAWEKEASWETQETLKELRKKRQETRLMEKQKKRENERKDNFLGSRISV